MKKISNISNSTIFMDTTLNNSIINSSSGNFLSQYKEFYDNLIAKNKIKEVIEKLLIETSDNSIHDLHSNILLVSSRFYRNQEHLRQGVIANTEYNLEYNRIITSLKAYLDDFYLYISKTNLKKNKSENSINQRNVFISYNHRDRLEAIKVKDYLEKEGINVTIDFISLDAGGDIVQFIEESIKTNDNILSLVSKNSLLSAWVAMESINTLDAQKVVNKKFIAIFIDNSFFKRNFVDEAIDSIDLEILDIKTTIIRRLEQNRNINDLENELQRYNDLKHNLPKIVQRLKESLSVNIIENEFEIGMKKIISTIIYT